jgi:hypothetical protein
MKLPHPALVASLMLVAAAHAQESAKSAALEGEMEGYLGVPQERVALDFGGGYSMHVAAWPLLEQWPGDRFQTGLFGTWMFAQLGKDKPEGQHYSDVEGGLGWWRDTRFATPTPKFIMGGVALEFVHVGERSRRRQGTRLDEPARASTEWRS